MACVAFSAVGEQNQHQGKARHDVVETLEEVAVAAVGRTASSDDDPRQ
jgi:hypothetical protein